MYDSLNSLLWSCSHVSIWTLLSHYFDHIHCCDHVCMCLNEPCRPTVLIWSCHLITLTSDCSHTDTQTHTHTHSIFRRSECWDLSYSGKIKLSKKDPYPDLPNGLKYVTYYNFTMLHEFLCTFGRRFHLGEPRYLGHTHIILVFMLNSVIFKQKVILE